MFNPIISKAIAYLSIDILNGMPMDRVKEECEHIITMILELAENTYKDNNRMYCAYYKLATVIYKVQYFAILTSPYLSIGRYINTKDNYGMGDTVLPTLRRLLYKQLNDGVYTFIDTTIY